MDDIARLSKEANLAYYEMVQFQLQKIKKTKNNQCHVAGERHLPAPGPVHSSIWSAQHQRGAHETKTGKNLKSHPSAFLMIALVPMFTITWQKLTKIWSPGEILQASAGGHVQEARLSVLRNICLDISWYVWPRRDLSGHTLICLKIPELWYVCFFLDTSVNVWTKVGMSGNVWTELLQKCCNHLWSLKPLLLYTLKPLTKEAFSNILWRTDNVL